VVDGDLREEQACLAAVAGMDAVVHAAGVTGGSKHVTVQAIPMFTDSLLMNTQLQEAARRAGVGHYLFLSNSSVYAKSEDWLREEDAWGETSRGIPENETGMVKRAGETQCGLYAKFTDMRIAIIRAGNAYGPRDNFDLESSHVMPALIRKAVERQAPYMVWGTGKMVRDFIHTRDIARGGLFLLERAAPRHCEPINIATGTTISIAELVPLILKHAEYADAVVQFDPTAPPTSPAKRIDLTKMREMGFQPETTVDDGVRNVIRWYRDYTQEHAA
jgi:GDP-L-fucose synthase